MGLGEAKAFEFLRGAPDATDLTLLIDLFGEAIRPLGFSNFGCIHYATPGVPISPAIMFGRSSVDWIERYRVEQLAPHDPTLQFIFSRSAPFSWSDISSRPLTPPQARVFKEAAREGLTSGFIVPVTGPYGEVAAVVMTGDRATELDRQERATLSALATVFATCGRTLREMVQDEADDAPLTPRESECLTWVMQGKTDWEIGMILTLSPRTVGNHINNAMDKLGTSSRAQAVFEAWRHGYLIGAANSH